MQVEFQPRKLLVQRLEEGWRLLADHDYIPGDRCILMHRPAVPEPININAALSRVDVAPARPRKKGQEARDALLNHLHEIAGAGEPIRFDCRQAMEALGCKSDATVYRHMKTLMSRGVVERLKVKRQHQPAQFRVVRSLKAEGAR